MYSKYTILFTYVNFSKVKDPHRVKFLGRTIHWKKSILYNSMKKNTEQKMEELYRNKENFCSKVGQCRKLIMF